MKHVIILWNYDSPSNL